MKTAKLMPGVVNLGVKQKGEDLGSGQKGQCGCQAKRVPCQMGQFSYYEKRTSLVSNQNGKSLRLGVKPKRQKGSA